MRITNCIKFKGEIEHYLKMEIDTISTGGGLYETEMYPSLP